MPEIADADNVRIVAHPWSKVGLPIALVAAVALLLGVAAPVNSDGTAGVHHVSVEAIRADGSRAVFRADVVADSHEEANTLARETVRLVAPGVVLGPPDAVEAAWLPWSWKWDTDEIPVSVAYNPTGAPLSVAPSAIIAGLQAWSNVSTSSFRFRYAGITDNTASILDFGPDGENVVSWASLPCGQGCVLGITSKESTHEVDMLLNSNPEAAEQLGVGATLDWRTVILHELGHMAGLEHSCPVPFGPCTEDEADAVMYFQYRGILRKLAADDIAGISALYPVSAGPQPTPVPPQPGVTPTPSPFPELPVILEAGWNLVVLPAGPVTSVTDILTCAKALYSYEDETWRAWIRDVPPALQDVTQLAANRAYWILADSACAHFFP